MAIYKRDIVDINLETGNIHRSFLKHSIGYLDQAADHFGIRVLRNGEPVDLTGVTVQGIFKPPQGNPIAITTGNIIEGNVAEVVLPQACYNYDGQFCLSIKLVDATNAITGTMRIVDGMVDNTHASGTVAPTGSVPTYQEILSVYDDLVDALADVASYAANFAPEFVQGTANAAGSFVMNDGVLYLLPDGHTAGTTWANTTKTQANVGGQLSDLKSALDLESGNTFIELLKDYYVNTNVNVGAEVNTTPATSSTGFSCAVVDCQEGDLFVVSGTGGGNARLYAFVDSDDKLIEKANENITVVNRIYKAPADAAKFIVNIKNGVAIQGNTPGNRLKVDEKTIGQIKTDAGYPFEYSWGTTDSSTGAVVPTQMTHQQRVSKITRALANTSIYFNSSDEMSVGFILTRYTDDAAFISKTVYTVNKNADPTVVTFTNDEYFRVGLIRGDGNTMTDTQAEKFAQLVYYGRYFDDKVLNGVELLYDINSEALHQGYLNRSTYQADTSLNTFKYVLHTCRPGDVFIYNGAVGNTSSPAVYYYNNSGFGCSDEPAATTVYRNHVIRIPDNCTLVGFSWLIGNGLNPCSVYRVTGDISALFGSQNDLLNMIGQNRYKNLIIDVNGDSISTSDAGKWSRGLRFTFEGSTVTLIGVGGTKMCGEINSDTRINNLNASADIVLTNGGANDWAADVPTPLGSLDTLDDPTTFAGAVHLYIQKVMTKCPNARIICMGTQYIHFDKFDDKETNSIGLRINDYNDMYRKVCQFDSVEFINIYELVGINRFNYATYLEQDAHPAWGENKYGYIHPNILGGKKYLDVILNYLYYGKNS